MEPDQFQQAWRAQSSQTRVTIDADLLSKEVERNHQAFQTTILLRDIREVVVAVVMIPVWFFLGAWMTLPWAWYLTVPACIWVAGFILVDRMRYPQKASAPGEPLVQSVQVSLAEVAHQIWLLRNVFWWYLLPFTISIMAFFGQVSWQKSQDWLEALIVASCYFVLLAVFYGFIYWLNQVAVRKQLEPRRQELLALLASLGDETGGDSEGGKENVSMNKPNSKSSASFWRTVFLAMALTAFTAVASFAAHHAGRAAAGYPKVSPFAAVRWQASQPEVQVGDEWYKLVSINDVPADEIVTFSQRTYGDLWQKRFEEDLVEVMAGMGREPKEKVKLAVVPLAAGKDAEEQTLDDVPMTEANRRAIRYAAQNLQPQAALSDPLRSNFDGPPRSSGPSGNRLASLVTDLRQEKNLVGLAAMVMVDGELDAAAAHGERKKYSGTSVELGDRWHLGGITKSITATMIARLVEAGKMKWTDTVGEAFPEASVHEDWKPVTLRQLLTDTAGAPTSFPREIWDQRPAPGPERMEARRKETLKVLAEKPVDPPGEKYEYSNVGYTMAAAMAEKATGVAWEDLVQREVFEPLGLADAGFGPPKSGDATLEQPRGHWARDRVKVAASDETDNSPIMGPSGSVHLTLQNLCAIAEEHLLGQLGEGKLLSDETYQNLHRLELDSYACGWLKKEPSAEIPYTTYWHNGSNTMWYALVVFIPEKKMVVAVAANDGDIVQAQAAAWEIVKESVNQYKSARGERTLGRGYPKLSPFAAVRWEESRPEIKVGGEWWELASIDEVPVAEVVAFSQRTNGELWRKRFEEDLVELLSRMGRPLGETVDLQVRSLDSEEMKTLEDVAMTAENRRGIREAALER